MRTAEVPSRIALGDMLARLGGTPMQGRHAVLGYGSNVVPGQLVRKLGADAVVPVLFGTLEGADVVYNLVSDRGYAYADLSLEGPGTRACVGITFLDEQQLRRVRRTEPNYRLAHAPTSVRLEGGARWEGGPRGTLLCFAGSRPVWVPRTLQRPVPVKGIACRGRARRALDQREVLALVISEFDLVREGIRSPEELSARLVQEAHRAEHEEKLKRRIQREVATDPRSVAPLVEQVRCLGELALPPRAMD